MADISQSTAALSTGSNDILKYVSSIVELFNDGNFKIVVQPRIVSSDDSESLEQFLTLARQNKKREACLIPFRATNKKMYTFGQICKPKATANLGDVAEGVFACAIAVRFTNRNSTVTSQDVINLLDDLGSPVSRGKGKVIVKTYKAENEGIDLKDDVILTIALAENNMNFLLNRNSTSSLQTYIDAAVKYANDDKVKKWAKLVYENRRYDKIEVISDGLSGQTTTKVDVEVKITDDNNILQPVDIKVSLKAGDVKQFGQKGGTNFLKEQTGKRQDGYKEYFNRLFGIDISNLESPYRQKSEIEHDVSGAINLVYDKVAEIVQQKLNSQTEKESILQTFGRAIEWFATLNEEYVELVQLNRGEAKIYNFANFANVLGQHDWDVNYTKGRSQSGESLPKIVIHKRGTVSDELIILRVKREVKDGGPYYRNYVEKGSFLGNLIGRYASAA